MRKSTFVMSWLLLFSLLLAACGGVDESSEGTAVLETQPTGFGTVIAPTLAGTAALESPAVTAEPAEMVTEESPEMVSPTVEATELPSTPAPVLPGTGAIDPSRLSNLLGLSVRTLDGEDVGEVEDVVIDLGESQVRYVVMASGGILGTGERLVPIPWDGVTIDPACSDTRGAGGAGTTSTETPAAGGTDITSGAGLQGGCFFTVNADQQTLENAPNVDLAAIPDVSVEDWDQEFLNYWNAFDMGTGGSQMVTSTPAAGGMAGTPAAGGTSTGTPGAGDAAGTLTPTMEGMFGTATPTVRSPVVTGTTTAGGAGSLTVSEMQGIVLATDLLDLNLASRDGDPLGEVEDAILDLETGVVRYILISADASMEIAGNWVPVPLETLSRGDSDALILDVEEDTMSVLSDAPSFDADSMPDTRELDWDMDISSYWDTLNP